MNLKYHATDTQQIIASSVEATVTNDVTSFCSFRRRTATTLDPDNQYTTVDNALSADIICPSPASGETIYVDEIAMTNRDTISRTITVYWTNQSLFSLLWRGVLEPNQSVYYCKETGLWTLSDPPYRSIKSFTVHGDAGANFAMTNATNAERFAGNSTRHLFLVDLSGYTQVRLRVNKQVGSASVNTPLFRAKYYTSYNTTVTNFLQLGQSSQIETSMTATGYYDSGWVNLATGAQIDGCCIGFTELGGDGVADPAVGATDILFR